MDEYPNSEEEYEMLHMDEMEAMAELEREMLLSHQSSGPRKSKSSLNFDGLHSDEANQTSGEKDLTMTDICDSQANEISKKRNLSSCSLVDMTSDLEIVEPPLKKKKSGFSLNENTKSYSGHEYGTTSFNLPKWPFVKISTDDGERLYVKIRNDPNDDKGITSDILRRKNSSLLETPYSTLRAEVEESYRQSLVAETNMLNNVEEELCDKANLWVEQFKPKTYFDLLSDEAVNRTLLNWLKMWDKVVFNKEVKEKTFNKYGNYNKENDFKFNQSKTLGTDGRPFYKIALLCGPPGLGKTTLAQIAAVMAGYNVIEVNASDDRSIEALGSKLDNATQMQPVMGKCKPSCLILDEIDGAPAPTIEFLLRYINGKSSEKAKKGKKESVAKVVKRPIICICNELYTPSLRMLRQQAFVVHFPNTSSTKLAHRLMEICKKQEIKTDVSALTLLCDKAHNDIRSCISTLHFFKNKTGQRFRTTDVLNSSIGMKDVQKSIFNVWKEIFQNPVKRTGVFSKALNKAVEDEVSVHVNYSKKAMDKLQNIVQQCQSIGDYDRLLDGTYENFLKSKFSGGNEVIHQGLEWFCWYDLLDTKMKKTQNYSLFAYLPYSFGMWQILFSSNCFWKIAYPTTGYENRVKESRNDQILSDIFRGLSPNLKAYNQKQSLLFDTLPLMDVILKPSLRPVNPTLFSEGEKKDFKHLIAVMVDFNMNYVQQRSEDGSYSYQLDPNVDELIKFGQANVNNTKDYTYNLKQIISHELELEKMRRSEGSEATAARAQVDTGKPAGLKPKQIQVKETSQYKDFFGRVVTRKDDTIEKGVADKNNPVKSPIWFCFKEGYNNAVKKDITINDLM